MALPYADGRLATELFRADISEGREGAADRVPFGDGVAEITYAVGAEARTELHIDEELVSSVDAVALEALVAWSDADRDLAYWRQIRADAPPRYGGRERIQPSTKRGDPVAALALAMLLAACTGAPAPEADPAPKPAPTRADNVLVVYVDTLRADRLGLHGYERDTSPFVDSLAESGVVFDRAIAASPWTFSSTASVMTGLYPATHGAELLGDIRNEAKNKGAVVELSDAHVTLAETAVEHGVRTAFFARNGYVGHGNQQGFETYANTRPSPATRQVDKALDWLQSIDEEERYLLFVHFMDVHVPNKPPEPFRSTWLDAPLDEDRLDECARFPRKYSNGHPHQVEGFDSFEPCRNALYDAAIRYVDHEVERLVRAVRARGGGHTTVIFTADHGEEIYDHGAIEVARYKDPRKRYGDGHGHSFFEEVIRIPLVVHSPGLLDPARVSTPVSNVDLHPTILSLMELPLEAQVEGIDLSPALQGRPLPERRLISDSVAFGTDRHAIVDGTKKLVWGAHDEPLLLDLASDAAEEKDLAPTQPEEVTRLREEGELLLKAQEAKGAGLLGGTAPIIHEPDAEERAALEALGYVWDDDAED